MHPHPPTCSLRVEHKESLRVVRDRVSSITPRDVELVEVLLERIGTLLHHHWLAATQRRVVVLQVEQVDVVVDVSLVPGPEEVALPDVIAGGGCGVDDGGVKDAESDDFVHDKGGNDSRPTCKRGQATSNKW
jgi:hypothetical protein